MIDLHEEFVGIARAFGQRDIPYALCGGLAMAAYGFPRATVDIDFLVPDDRMNDAQACLRELGYDHESGWMSFAGGKVRLFRVVKLDPAAGDFLVVDLLAAAGDLAAVWEQRRLRETDDGSVWIVSRPGLIAMKGKRGSQQDLADIENLEGISDED